MVLRSTLFTSNTFGAGNKCPSESDRLIEGQKREYRKAGTNLQRCPSYRGSNKGSKERQGPTRSGRFTEVSAL